MVNFRSIRNKGVKLFDMMTDLKPTVVIGTETWLNEDISSEEIIPAGYTVYRKDRSDHGGGVIIMVQNHVPSSSVNVAEVSSEICWCSITLDKRKIGIVAAYRPERDDLLFSNLLIQWQKLSFVFDNIVVAGDFNIRGYDWVTGENLQNRNTSVDFLDSMNLMMEAMCCEQIVDKPTRIMGESANILDLIFTDFRGCSVEVLQKFSDHQIVLATFDAGVEHTNCSTSYTRWNYKKADKVNLTRALEDSYISFKSFTGTLDERVEFYTKSLDSAANSFIPKETVNSKRNSIWICKEAKSLMLQRKRIRKLLKMNYSPDHLYRLEELSRKITDILDKNRTDHVIKLCEQFSTKPRNFWNYIRNFHGGEANICQLNQNGVSVNDPKVMADIFNEVLCKNFSTLDSDILLPPIENFVADEAGNVVVSYEGVLAMILKLDDAKSPGPGGVPVPLLKLSAEVNAMFLTDIFNASIMEAYVPKVWRVASVVPLHKKGDKQDPQNYRPISLTSNLCKMLEHIIVKHCYVFLLQKNILCANQFGFREGASTELLLVELIHKITEDMQGGGQVDVVSLDLVKAFDRVPHSFLIHKLHAYGLGRNADWFASFLEGRSQRVCINGAISEGKNVISGVPQGSVCGPFLFIVYLNDLMLVLNNHGFAFADDSDVLRKICSHEDAIALQEVIDFVVEWCRVWGMEIQPLKSTALSCSRGREPIMFDYNVGDVPIPKDDRAKILGVTLNSDLSWENHVNKIAANASGRIRFLSRILKNFSPTTKMIAYKSLVRPLLEYASAAWDPYLGKLIDKLEMVQRRAVRFVEGNFDTRCSVSNLAKKWELPTLAKRRKDSRLCLLHKIVNNNTIVDAETRLAPPYFIGKNDHEKKLRVWQPQNDYFRLSFYPRTVREWNCLPAQCVSQPTLASFKKAVQALPF